MPAGRTEPDRRQSVPIRRTARNETRREKSCIIAHDNGSRAVREKLHK